MLGQLLDDVLAEKELEEAGFGDIGSELDVIEAAFTKFVDHKWLVIFKDNEVHGSTPGRRRCAGRGRTQFVELGVAELDAFGLQRVEKLEQVGKPAAQLDTSLPALAIMLGHGAQRVKMFGRRDNILRSALTAIGEDGAFVQLAARATASLLATLAAQGVKRARQQGRPLETCFEQTRQELLGLIELLTQRAKRVAHRRNRVAGHSVDQVNKHATEIGAVS